MARNTSFLLVFITNCVLVGVAYGLIGNVRYTHKHEYPFAVSIAGRAAFNHTDPRHFNNLHFCTGTLVSHKSIITAAHCLAGRQPSTVEIIAGASNLKFGQRYYPESWITFDQWNHNRPTLYHLNDIAVIIVIGEGISNFIPPATMFFDNAAYNGEKMRMAGWGKADSGKMLPALKTGKMIAVSNEECSNQGTMLKGKKFTVPLNYFCTKADPWVLSSPGDGGAPILDRHFNLVGINIGVCPIVEGYPEDMLHQVQMNSNLNLHYYNDFLNQNIIK